MKVEVEEKGSKMEQIKSFVRDNWSTIISGSICIVASGLIGHKIGYKQGRKEADRKNDRILDDIVRCSSGEGLVLVKNGVDRFIFTAKKCEK